MRKPIGLFIGVIGALTANLSEYVVDEDHDMVFGIGRVGVGIAIAGVVAHWRLNYGRKAVQHADNEMRPPRTRNPWE